MLRCAVGVLWAVVGFFNLAQSQVLTPPYFNLAEGRLITSTATCGYGVSEPELYCKLVGAHADQKDNPNVNLIQGQVCDYCDPSINDLDHRPQNAIDGTEKWWQSPPLSRGNVYNEVNLTIDLGQEFHVAYVFIRMANSPRPGIWALERSTDHGDTWKAWQYFADNPNDCIRYFGRETLEPITADDSVTCETRFSTVVPLEGGEIVVSLLHDRPNANNFYNSTLLQNWTKATNIRLRLLRTKTLLGHLMSVAREDPTVTRRYFYSIRDISIGGRCVCNGHADTCDITDPNDQYKLLCRCQHNTCGAQCEQCCYGYVQKKWRPATPYKQNDCELCNCFGHSNDCVYDEETDLFGLSLDLSGHYDGGGVCQNCQHNTEGINCNRCKPGYYRPYGKPLNVTDVCHACQCDVFYSTGSCFEGNGQCECRIEFLPPLCDQCNFGYFGYPNCRPCDCHLNGTRGFVCEVGGGQCPCRPNFTGKNCEQCAEGYYKFPECLPCDCNPEGSADALCDIKTGQCPCRTNFGGRSCSDCDHGFYDYPSCQFCSCDQTGCTSEICNKSAGACICKEGFGGIRCDRCAAGYFGHPNCIPCNCDVVGSTNNACDDEGKCQCLRNFAGLQCTHCSPGYYQYPQCLPCNCDSSGSVGVSCLEDGHCQCRPNFDGLTCNSCREGFYNFPACEECNCDPAGVLETFAGCGSLTTGELCQCKERVTGRICNQCRSLYWNLQASNPMGCEDCVCHLPGTVGAINMCDGVTGQCYCKPNVASRQCEQCGDGFYDLQEDNLFGCVDCGCNIGGSLSRVCDKQNGQCSCHPRIMGRTCNEPMQLHYFPNLYQLKFEMENGYTPTNSPVRFGYSRDDFAQYSWRGYAIFSVLQKEVLTRVFIDKPSLYLVVLSYVNLGSEAVIGHVTIIPDAYGEIKQSSACRFEPTTTPKLVTVAGAEKQIPTPFVINPGRWTVSIKIEKPIFVDYFVLLPAAYYEATLLQEQVNTPCKLDPSYTTCRHYLYPELNDFSTVRGEAGYIEDGENRVKTQLFTNEKLLELLGTGDEMGLMNSDQREMRLDIRLPKAGRYAVIILYHTPEGGQTCTLHMEASSTSGRDKGRAILYDCMFTTLCRQAVTDPSGRVIIFNFESNFINIVLSIPEGITVAIDSVVAIPTRQWNIDYISPRPSCVRQDGACVGGRFQTIPGTVKLEMEAGSNEKNKATKVPATLLDHNVGLIYLDHKDALVDIRGSVPQEGKYVFVVHYYQPKHPEFDLDVVLQNGQFYEATLPIPFCPSVSGCRSIIKNKSGEKVFKILENFLMTFKEPNHKSVWLDYILVIPADHYKADVLEEIPLDKASEFITLCGQDNFFIDTKTAGFCRDASFTLTADYNNGGLPCQCNLDGSLSLECDQFGGQCLCKSNVIGRTCSECQTGYFGFPDCHPCACPSTAVCHPTTGECICPPRVTGENCDSCLPNTYGYDPIIGCEECNCNPHGVENGNLQCGSLLGDCDCRVNVVGRTCDSCQPGYWSFPYCQLCDCDLRGTTEDICDMNTAQCHCKENVEGPTCDQCKLGTFYLEEKNPLGCTKCYCSGRTDRCTSATMFRTQVFEIDGWEIAFLQPGTSNVQPADKISIDYKGGQIKVKLKDKNPSGNIIYFSAPLDYLGNKLTSYGGFLRYIITFNTSPDKENVALFSPDVIIIGNNMTLLHENPELPSSGEPFDVEMPILETNFHLLSGGSVTREQLMLVLTNIDKIYIRGEFFNGTKDITLQRMMLDISTTEFLADTAQALTVEQCLCPPNYRGSSCEYCAAGYYLSDAGPYGEFCIPCQCHGHADTCDPVTGQCINCKHNTTGEHCETCVSGFHGDATIGTPYDCLICACPIPTMANNFATSCEFSPSGQEIHCECKHGYYGPRCSFCAAGFYGRPEVPNEICRPCNCSGNIDASNFGSCDSQSGECLRCLNNTSGSACELCAPGFYGDAVESKNCKSCSCDNCGTRECHHSTGICRCHANVIGEKCDECAPGFYGFAICNGCVGCDCSVASESSQCEMTTGQCKCREGVTGRACDHCKAGYWKYSAEGCQGCECRQKYSIGGSCNPRSGQCECLPGVIGDNCDRCPHRWVLIENIGCNECDPCVHFLLDDVDSINTLFYTSYWDIKNISAHHFANLRLTIINKTVDTLRPLVDALRFNQSVDLGPLSSQISDLESDIRQLDLKASTLIDTASDKNKEADETRMAALDLEKKVNIIVQTALEILNDINRLAQGIFNEVAPDIDMKIAEAERLLREIKRRDFSIQTGNSESEDRSANQTLENARIFAALVEGKKEQSRDMQERMTDLRERLNELMNTSRHVINNARTAKETYDPRKLQSLKGRVAAVETTLKEIAKLLGNGTSLVAEARDLLERARETFDDIFEVNAEQLRVYVERLRSRVDKLIRELQPLNPLVQRAEAHAKRLKKQADELASLLVATRVYSENALNAANAYKFIVKAINEALKAAEDAVEAANKSQSMSEGLDSEAAESKEVSDDLWNQANDALKRVKPGLQSRMAEAKDGVDIVDSMNRLTRNGLAEIKRAIDRLPVHGVRPVAYSAMNMSFEAETKIANAMDLVEEVREGLANAKEQAQQIPRDIDDANKDMRRAEEQIQTARQAVPEMNRLMNRLMNRTNALRILGIDVGDKIAELRRRVTLARDTANRIKVGIRVTNDVVLQLRNPEGLTNAATHNKMSLYFKTTQKNGFLAYLGNEIGTHRKIRRALTDDFMSIGIEKGRIVLSMDMGSGVGRIYHPTEVSDGEWHQVIIERTGKTAVVTVTTQDMDDEVKIGEIEGSRSVFNLDQEHSKLYVGGLPDHDRIQSEIVHRHFEGDIEDLHIDNNPVGFWSFAYGLNNRDGCLQRNQLVISSESTGLHFDGAGYVILNRRSSYKFQHRVELILRFKTYAKDGLLFLIGKNADYLAVELRDGYVYFHFNLGSGVVVLTHQIGPPLNDGQWHRLQASRIRKDAILMVDAISVANGTAPGPHDELSFTDDILVGGFPGNHTFKHVTNVDFEGCIGQFQIGQTTIDLNYNKEALGVVPGCPEKVSRSISFNEASPGYVQLARLDDKSDLLFTFKMKTVESDGLLFYMASRDQSSFVSLSLQNGSIVFITRPGGEVRTKLAYNDQDWHFITATRVAHEMRLDVDDFDEYKSTSFQRGRVVIDTPIFVAGVPSSYRILSGRAASTRNYIGCIGDTTLNGIFLNFANSTDRVGGSLASCPIADPTPTPLITPTDMPVTWSPPTSRPRPGKTTTGPWRPQPIPTVRPTVGQCALPLRPHGDPDLTESSGIRFGVGEESREEYQIATAEFRTVTNLSVEFKTTFGEGILFYVTDSAGSDFVAVYLYGGAVYFTYNLGSGSVNFITTKKTFNDGVWHRLVVTRDKKFGSMVIDKQRITEGISGGQANTMEAVSPLYVGGISKRASATAKKHIQKTDKPFNGCLRKIKIADRIADRLITRSGTQPCSDKVEPGSFFSADGGYLILYDNYRVGFDLNIYMEIKPRSISGVIMAINGKEGDYLVLQLVDGKVKFSVDNGAGAIEVSYLPEHKHALCDGKWHKIKAVKAKNIAMLSVDDQFVDPAIGKLKVTSADTNDPLHFGGVPDLRSKGIETTEQFVGCIRNVQFNNKPHSFASARSVGNVMINVCPTI